MFHNSHRWANIFAQSIPLQPPFCLATTKFYVVKRQVAKKVELRGLNMWAQLEHAPTDTKFKV